MNIDDKRYIASLRSTSSVGSCPSVGAEIDQAVALSSLLADGVFVLDTNIGENRCVTFTLSLTDSLLGSVISSENVQISNV